MATDEKGTLFLNKRGRDAPARGDNRQHTCHRRKEYSDKDDKGGRDVHDDVTFGTISFLVETQSVVFAVVITPDVSYLYIDDHNGINR